jgi:nucleotide sugar dehydrogenase
MGYVGLVGAMCLASMGHEVVGVDIVEEKIKKLKSGELPIYEEGLEEYYKKAMEEGKVSFTTDIKEAVEKTDLCFVCVGTPSRKDGTVNLSYVESAAAEVGRALKDKDSFYTVCFRSTIPPGTSNNLIIPILERESGKKVGKDFGYAFNPEFLREGTAIYDFFNPTLAYHPLAKPLEELVKVRFLQFSLFYVYNIAYYFSQSVDFFYLRKSFPRSIYFKKHLK